MIVTGELDCCSRTQEWPISFEMSLVPFSPIPDHHSSGMVSARDGRNLEPSLLASRDEVHTILMPLLIGVLSICLCVGFLLIVYLVMKLVELKQSFGRKPSAHSVVAESQCVGELKLLVPHHMEREDRIDNKKLLTVI